MGFGDYLLLSGKLREVKKLLPSVQVSAKRLEGKFFFEEIFRNNPYLTRSNELKSTGPWIDLEQIQTGKKDESSQRIIWDVGLTPVRGDLFFESSELTFAKSRLQVAIDSFKRRSNKPPENIVFIAPIATAQRVINGETTSYSHAKNKEWPIRHWSQLISRLEHSLFIVTGPEEYRDLAPAGSHFVETSFRQACAILSLCDLFVGIEGGLHHAAAALHKPGIVFFGHWNSPEITGYGIHFNLQKKDAPGFHGCGSLNECPACQKWLEDLSPVFVESLMDVAMTPSRQPQNAWREF